MNPTNSLFGVIMLSAALILPGMAQDASPTIRVAALKGSTSTINDRGQVKRLTAGTVLGPGAVITTGPGCAVDFFLGNQAGTVRLTERSTLAINDFTTNAEAVVEIQMHLSSGTLLGMGNQLPKTSRFQIKISHGIVDVQARQYRIGADGLLVAQEGLLLFAHIPADGRPVLHRLNAPPPTYFWPEGGVKPAPEALVREVTAQINARLP